MSRVARWALLSSLLGAMGTHAAESEAPVAGPFVAEVIVDEANVRARSSAEAPSVGLLEHRDRVVVRACVPDCASPRAWALVEGDGAVRLSSLRPLLDEAGDADRAGEAAARYHYARVRGGGARVRRAPDPDAPVIARFRAGRDLAFRVDEELAARGWLERPSRGFVAIAEVRPLVPSRFAGVHDPALPLAFTVRALDTPSVARFEALRVTDAPEAIRRRTVETERGIVPRSAVRLARLRPPPPGVPDGAQWVHIDRREQTLVAYEGARPVLATLISTGKEDDRTHRGLHRVYYKTIHGAMHGRGGEDYFVDEVPFVEYFRRNEALHGTFWHERFGTAVSHGCVNLSFADAEWLFDWAPPTLPRGWHAVTREPALWVLVE